MVLIKSFIFLIGLQFAVAALAEEAAVEAMVKRINQRHDDFYAYRREQEERAARFNSGTDERKKREQAHLAAMEKARLEYVKNRRERPSLEHLRIKAENEEKERQVQHEMMRRRYVQQRDTVEQYLKKGRTIPELKEFDLEGY